MDHKDEVSVTQIFRPKSSFSGSDPTESKTAAIYLNSFSQNLRGALEKIVNEAQMLSIYDQDAVKPSVIMKCIASAVEEALDEVMDDVAVLAIYDQ